MSVNHQQWLGLPLNLIWGYVAIAVFMTGDGFELAFLSHYIKELGFSPAQASFAFTLYPAWSRKLSPRVKPCLLVSCCGACSTSCSSSSASVAPTTP
ncbi:hypothetical protein MUW95_07980 [Klebsiella aerogenes]|nr:hypothetical protein [Klebsiella aerogenes]MCL9941776.1 hypothetical protein [Klebsiella aerogenes]